MIAACPRCRARYRIEPERLGSEGVRLRCSRCEAIFRVRAPISQADPNPPSTVARASQRESVPPIATTSAPATRDEVSASSAVADRKEIGVDSETGGGNRLVLIADPEVEAGKATANAVAGWGLAPILVHDGVEAIMGIQRMLPRVVVMDAALPKMFGFQVCELLKRNDSLRDIHVVLVGAIHNRDRYRRPPTELYGADSYVERHELAEKLRGILDGIGMQTHEVSSGAPPPIPSDLGLQPATGPQHVASPEPALGRQPVARPVAPVLTESNAAPSISSSPAEPKRREDRVSPPEVPPAPVDPRVADAERLARIVVSDIILYNQEKFDVGVRDGNVLEAMASDLAEGRSLFEGRVESSVRGQRDFLAERLTEVARDRGMS